MVNYTTPMVMSMKETGLKIKQTEEEFTHMQMVLNIMEIGKMINSTDME